MPEQTAYSGVSPGAEMSTPWSSDQLPGGEAASLGSGKVKPPELETWDGNEDPELELLAAACEAWA